MHIWWLPITSLVTCSLVQASSDIGDSELEASKPGSYREARQGLGCLL